MKMTLVKLVENKRRNTGQCRIGKHLTQQNAFRDKQNARIAAGDIVQANAISDLPAETDSAFLRNPRRQHSSGQSARLKNDALPIPKQSPIEKDLRNLGGFSRTCRRL